MINRLKHLSVYCISLLSMGLAILSLLAPQIAQAGDIQVLVTDNAGKPLENAVVYADSINKAGVLPNQTAAIGQKNRKFVPLVSVIQTGTSVSFPNSDNVRHHVYSFSPAKNFELKLYSGVPSAPVIFDKPGVVVLGCNIHDSMVAFVNVVDTPYFGKTDATGNVTLKELPNGAYTLKVWHYALTKENAVVEQALNVKGNEQASIKLSINADAIINR